jgi:hypothetical protein
MTYTILNSIFEIKTHFKTLNCHTLNYNLVIPNISKRATCHINYPNLQIRSPITSKVIQI